MLSRGSLLSKGSIPASWCRQDGRPAARHRCLRVGETFATGCSAPDVEDASVERRPGARGWRTATWRGLGVGLPVFGAAALLTLVFDGRPTAAGWRGGALVAVTAALLVVALELVADRALRSARADARRDASSIIRGVTWMVAGFLAADVMRAGRFRVGDALSAVGRPVALVVVLLLGVAVLAGWQWVMNRVARWRAARTR